MRYEFDPADARKFAEIVGIYSYQKGNELTFKYCPYCNGSEKDQKTFSINMDTGVFQCFRSSCGVKGNMIRLAKDFNFKLSGYRKADSQVIKNDFSHVFWEDPLTAIKYLFWARDARGGAGERKVFREALLWLAENKPEIVKAVIPLIGEYGRYDDLLVLLDTPLRQDVSSYYKRGSLYGSPSLLSFHTCAEMDRSFAKHFSGNLLIES